MGNDGLEEYHDPSDNDGGNEEEESKEGTGRDEDQEEIRETSEKASTPLIPQPRRE